MPRLPRFDGPGRWFHVMNRGLAKRPVFESRADVRYFLSRLAYAVRRGEIEVHVFCVLTNHFHLLVRSPTGQLSEAMRRIQNEYVRYFNRTRRRDGPLFRGRFISKPVRSLVYRMILVRYIDENALQAGLARTPWSYPYGSATRFQSGRPPRWLCGTWILGQVAAAAARSDGTDYASVWGRPITRGERDLVEARIAGRGLREDDLDDLIGATPARVRDWMLRKTQLADGTRPGLCCVPPRIVMEVVNELQSCGRKWTFRFPGGRCRDAWGVGVVGLLRHLAGQTYREISERLSLDTSLVSRRSRLHASLCEEAAYAERVGRVAALCVRAAFPEASATVRNRS